MTEFATGPCLGVDSTLQILVTTALHLFYADTFDLSYDGFEKVARPTRRKLEA